MQLSVKSWLETSLVLTAQLFSPLSKLHNSGQNCTFSDGSTALLISGNTLPEKELYERVTLAQLCPSWTTQICLPSRKRETLHVSHVRETTRETKVRVQ